MEFAHVGKNCQMKGCNQQDFMPFQCTFCQDIHCADHRRAENHKCTKGGFDKADDNYVIVCPDCDMSINMKGTAYENRSQMEALKFDHHVKSMECAIE